MNLLPFLQTKKYISLQTGMLFCCIFLTFCVYIPSFSADFVNWDDDDYVRLNNSIQSFANWKTLLTQPLQGNYHPITMLSLALNYAISGNNAVSYHVLNVLLHLINVALVFLFTKELTQGKLWIAFVTALLFGIHPMHVESVAWVSERKDVLYACFFLIGLVQYLDFIRKNQTKYYLFTLFFFVLSLLSKPAAVIFPVVLLSIDLYKGREKLFQTYYEKIPFFLLSFVVGYLTYTAQQHEGALVDTTVITWTNRFFFGFYGMMMYVWKAIYPLHLVTFYAFPDTSNGLTVLYYISPIFSFFLLLLVLFTWKKYRFIAFGVIFYVVNLLLVLQFVSVGGAIIADRYTYIPYIGLFFIAGWAVEWLIDNHFHYISAIIGSILTITLLILCHQQVKVWDNGGTLWNQAIRYAPCARVYVNRALVFHENKELSQAIAYYSKAIVLSPEDNEAYCNRANIYLELHEEGKALSDYRKSIALNAEYYAAWDNLGALYVHLFQNDSAIRCFNQAIELKENYKMPYYNRAVTFMDDERYDLALPDFEKYLLLNEKDDPDVLNSMAVCYQKQGNHPAAILHLDKAIALKEHPIFYLNRALSYAKTGNKKAFEDVELAKRLGGEVDEELQELLNKLKN
jgi:protein O-mannosyl-transferase